MTQLRGLREGDIVKCDVKGRRFHAVVRERRADGGLNVTPIERGVNYFAVTARQVLEVWTKRRPRRSREDPPTA